ncbi:methionine--tRNA ligase [Demequina iriomotensis]|uniref:methionine--tRNA ligase n=1 Tax=Demequina iriomotensis TaxID=1536641 RepID=UPI000784068F|nr:methionine--tRNA ligase [Demequina iriomotensis]
MSRILSAVAWPYANGPRHIGHVAGFGVPSDVFSRYMRLAGHDVLMVSGTDEHGTPILVQAEGEGVSPQELADRYNRVIVEDLTQLGLSYDLFTRTTTGNHYAVAQAMFKAVHKNGYMISETTRGAISPSTGRTLPDRYIEGTCPICGSDGARGDQCDACGNQLDAIDLKNPVSRINGETPKFIETEHFFLDLPALVQPLTDWLGARQGWRPNVLNFSRNLLADVRPRAMTRDIDWGIPVPLEGWEDNPAKRLYVWFDAVIGYLSASIEWARREGDGDAWRQWWNNPEALSYYFMGKDNITFHSQIWPGELIAANGRGARGGELSEFGDLQLPTEVVSSEFLTMESAKFSSSRGHVIYVRDMLSRYQPDALRYFIAVAGPETSDADFTWSEFKRRNNDELVAGWGNLVNRTASLLHKNVGEIPSLGELADVDRAALAASEAAFGTVGEHIRTQRQRAAISETMRVIGDANKYLADTAPWKLKNEDPERMRTVLAVAAQLVSDANTMMSPFLPHSAQKVHEALGGTGVLAPMPQMNEVADLDLADRHYPVIQGDYSSVGGWGRIDLVAGTAVPAPSPIFQKLDDEMVEAELERMADE